MNIELTHLSGIKKQLTVSLSAEDFKKEIEKAYEKIGKKAKLKGFRPGKIPRKMLEKYYGQDAQSDAVEEAINNTYPKALEQKNIFPVDYPRISVKKISQLEGLVYDAEVEVRPVMTVQDYEGVRLVKETLKVDEKEIEAQLENMRQQFAQVSPVTGRFVQSNDIIVMDWEAFVNKKKIQDGGASGYLVELGTGYLFPDFEKGLLGMEIGVEKEISVTYPADWHDKKFAEKVVAYHVKITEIREKKLPELNDEFAKDTGHVETLEELKSKISEDIRIRKEDSMKHKWRRDMVESLEKKNIFEIPEAMIRMELEEMFHRFAESLRIQGMTPERVGISQEDFFTKNKEEAIFRVKSALLFDAIAQKENIVSTEEDLEKWFEEHAAKAGQPVLEWKRYYQQKNWIPALMGQIREDKTFTYLLSKAKIKEI